MQVVGWNWDYALSCPVMPVCGELARSGQSGSISNDAITGLT